MSTTLGNLADVLVLLESEQGELLAGTPQGLFVWQQEAWQPRSLTFTGTVTGLALDATGRLAVVGPEGLEVDGASVPLPAGARPSFVGSRSAGGFWIAGANVAGYWDGTFQAIRVPSSAPVVGIVEDETGAWWLATAEGVASETGVSLTLEDLIGDEVRGLTSRQDGAIWVGTNAGLVFKSRESDRWASFLGEDGLHYGDIRRLRTDRDDDLLIATSIGASVFRKDGSRRYYNGRVWLVDNEVRDLVRLQSGELVFATAAGVSKVEPRPMTLAERASIYDRITQDRHVRLGYTSTENHLREAGNVDTFFNLDDDNDGQWTAMYLASQCFRYAVTGDSEARENAKVAAFALIELEKVTPLQGFFARAILPADECGDPEARDGEWHLTEDGSRCWKGDTSSDELVGHIFGLSLFHDLAATEEEKPETAAALARIVDYIVDGGLVLKDIDGEVTTWGHFDPDWMENSLTALLGDAGLNSAMILGALHAAHHVTGAARFRETFRRLAHEENYKDNVSRIEEINLSIQINHDSEEMAFLALYTLMRYEDDPELMKLWRKGLDYLWEVQRPERNPEFNFMYGALSQVDDPDLDISIETLQKLPLDLVLWGTPLSHRWDRREDGKDRHGALQNEFVFPYDEREAMRWAENPYRYDSRHNGHAESSGTYWLLPYWMARYHGYIQ